MTDLHGLNFLILLLLVTFLTFTGAAVVGHHPNSVRKSLQHQGASISSPSFLLFRRTSEIDSNQVDDINHGQDISSRLGVHSPEDGDAHSFMMISTSTFTSNPFAGSDRIDENDHEPPSGFLSIDMTIIQFEEPPPPDSRKVPGRFGSKYPLYLESASNQENVAPQSNQQAASRKVRDFEVTPPATAPQKLKNLWQTANESGTLSPWSVSDDKAPLPTIKNTSHRDAPVIKPVKPDSFGGSAKKQMFFSSSPTFDSTSHHSQL